MLAYGAVPKSGVVSDSGVISEVEERWVTTAGAEGSEVSSLGKVGGGVGERSGISAGVTVPSGVDRVRPGVVRVRSEFICEARSGLGGEVSAGSEVTPRLEAASGMSRGAESVVTGGPGGSGEADGAGEAAGGAVLAAVGRCPRRSGHGFLWEPGGGGQTDRSRSACPAHPLGLPRPSGEEPTNERVQSLATSWFPSRLCPAPAPHLPATCDVSRRHLASSSAARELEGGEGYRGRWEGAETWGAGTGGWRGLRKREGRCGSVGIVAAHLGMQAGLKGRGDEGANGEGMGEMPEDAEA